MAIGAASRGIKRNIHRIMGIAHADCYARTMSIIKGALLVFVGKNWITQLPNVLIEFSRSNLLASVGDTGESIGLHSSVIILLVVALIVWALLRYTWFGRSIYAIGTNQIAAERDGIACKKTKFIACILSGVLAALAGLIHCSLVRVANPFDIFGTELNVIAAVVLGELVYRRAGTVAVPYWVFLINIINNS